MVYSDSLYKKTEAILYNYNKTKAQIKNIDLEIESVKNEFEGVGSISYEERIQSTNSFRSRVENEVMNRDNEINKLGKYKRQKEIEVAKIDNAIESLPEREKAIIEMRYLKKYNNRMIAAQLDLTEEYVCRIKKFSVNKLLNLIF